MNSVKEGENSSVGPIVRAKKKKEPFPSLLGGRGRTSLLC